VETAATPRELAATRASRDFLIAITSQLYGSHPYANVIRGGAVPKLGNEGEPYELTTRPTRDAITSITKGRSAPHRAAFSLRGRRKQPRLLRSVPELLRLVRTGEGSLSHPTDKRYHSA